MRQFVWGLATLASVSAFAGLVEARERQFLFFRWDDGRGYNNHVVYQQPVQQPAAQQVTPPAAPPAEQAAQPAAQQPAAQQTVVVEQPVVQQQPVQQQQNYYYEQPYYYQNRSSGNFFDGIMEFERSKNAWLRSTFFGW